MNLKKILLGLFMVIVLAAAIFIGGAGLKPVNADSEPNYGQTSQLDLEQADRIPQSGIQLFDN